MVIAQSISITQRLVYACIRFAKNEIDFPNIKFESNIMGIEYLSSSNNHKFYFSKRITMLISILD